ncbi:MAG: MBL fold metallo-hydrolase [Betaproteobacteria bacterium]|nr:MBL fold metallo-hydrolase [Betaproteobacteria bacterium]
MQLTFHGAAGEVTGSCMMVEASGARFLVDCGLFQGGRDAWRKNLAALDFDLRSLDFVVLSHAHLDHSGLLPRLTALGYRGPIYATRATVDLLGVMLLDSAHIQEKELEWDLRRRRARGDRRMMQPAPLYTVAQAQGCLAQVRGVDYDAEFRPHPRVRVRLRDAGHILGSSIVELWVGGEGGERKLVFSGDLGQPARPVVRDPFPVEEADVLVVESTYGNRLHKPLAQTEEELVEALGSTLRHGNVIIPAFSVGRTQEILFVLADLARRGRLGRIDVYVDSPMALAATQITLRHQPLLDQETRDLIAWQAHSKLAPQVRFVQDVEESKALNRTVSGAVIISASGMCDAGRIKYHLLHNLPRKECAVVIAGFQAQGSLGRRLVDGARKVTLFGETVAVRARILTVGGLSAHADRQGLLDWLGHFRRPPGRTFVVHGEAATAQAFAETIAARLRWQGVCLPRPGERQLIA